MKLKTIRAAVRDVAFTFRMGAGFAGDINRVHPFSVEPCLIDASAPPTAFGQIVVADATTNGVRPLAAGDASDSVVVLPYGVTVRSFPTQVGATGASAPLGAATPPTSGIIDVLRSGYIMGKLNTGSAAPTKGLKVFIWCAATSGNHIQGGYESAETSGSTVELDPRFTFNGPADANGIVEISANV